MNLQAMIDDSRDDRGVFVLAGYIAEAESWARFSIEWEKTLPYAVLGPSGTYRFKMAEMATTAERMNRVSAFYRIIEDHVLGWVSVKINTRDLDRVQKRIFVPGVDIDWGHYSNPYYIAFRCLMDKFHIERPSMSPAIPLEQKIDFFFDEQAEKGLIMSMWDQYFQNRPSEVQKYYGARPKFQSDDQLLPLQAADFWAWWVRKWYVEGEPEKILKPDFGHFQHAGKKKYLRVAIDFDQEALMGVMIKIIREQIGQSKPIIDLRGLDAFGG